MRIYQFAPGVKRTLFCSLAGFSVILTAVKSLRGLYNVTGVSTCRMKAYMSDFSQHKLKLGLFMADFDQTCNMRDTSELYYRATQKYQKSSAADRRKLDEQWSHVTGKYLREYREQIASTLSKFDRNVSSEFDETKLHSFLLEIANFNRIATRDVDESKLIVGVDDMGLQLVAKMVKFYPSCSEVLHSILPYVRIVSVNWSAEMIMYAFNKMIPAANIYANKLLDDNGVSSGLVGKEYISSFDKLKLVKRLINSESGRGTVTVFVGDSITDLLSLLEADLGIIIGSSNTLLSVAGMCGIRVLPLSSLLQQREIFIQCEDNGRKTLYNTQDWHQIKKLLTKFSV